METASTTPNPTITTTCSSSNQNNNNHHHDAETTTAAAAAAAPENPQEPHPEPPPPPPPPHILPGPRAARLQELYAQSLRRTLAKLKWENFAACYPTVASRAEPVLRQVQAQMVEKLGEKCEVRFPPPPPPPPSFLGSCMRIMMMMMRRWAKKEKDVADVLCVCLLCVYTERV
jgi:kinetochore protein NNF1